eukprot:c15702_g1_i1 orf=408-1433(-)
MAAELLEGRRSLDNRWYHCQVSVCSNEGHNILKVHFSEKDEEEILTLDEAQSRLRPQSKCLVKGECIQLQVGDTVLIPSCRTELGKVGCCEAQIREIFRHQHSSSEMCNCKLEVLPIDERNEESSCVPASEVRRVDLLSSLHDNPVIRDWIDSTSKQQGSHRLDTSNGESDIHAQLDEEINKITMMTDGFNETYLTTTQNSADAPTDTPKRRNLRSRSSSCQRRHKKELSTNITRSRQSINKQPRLSPLAARAALAATVLTGSLKQGAPPSVLESKVMGLQSNEFRPDSGPKIAAKNDSRKCQRVLRPKELRTTSPPAQSRMVTSSRKRRGKSSATSGLQI